MDSIYTEYTTGNVKRPKHAREYLSGSVLWYDHKYIKSIKRKAAEDYQTILNDDNYSWIDVKLALLNYEWLDFLECYSILMSQKSEKVRDELLSEYIIPLADLIIEYFPTNQNELLNKFRMQINYSSIKEFMYGRLSWDDKRNRWGKDNMWNNIYTPFCWEEMKKDRAEWCLSTTHEIRRGIYLYLAIEEGFALDADWKEWKKERE